MRDFFKEILDIKTKECFFKNKNNFLFVLNDMFPT